ncbi:MAG: peptidase MA family metallohydrolase [Candidatus Limnocylindria bacterium]
MGRVIRWTTGLLAAAALGLGVPQAVAAFDGFGDVTADSTYDVEIRFEVELLGGVPDRLELLTRTPGSEVAVVAPVEPGRDSATFVWNTAVSYVTPNTPVTYWWRATTDGDVVLSPEATIRYEDDREGLDWQRAQLGEATVHWYGNAEAQARRFGELTADGVSQAEDLLGTQLAGPVDVFVYATREDFFGALGPGAREWTGAAAYSELRTIFMWLGAGSASYLEVAMLHEVTHIVFFDATDNPFHEPARWLNEGIATWSESGDAGEQGGIVSFEAGGGGLFSFEAISEQFPIGDRGGQLSYAQGTTMVDMIIDRYGREAIARVAAALRDGATDAEALEAGTGVPADQLHADFFSEFGVEAPEPITPDPIAASNVDRPPSGVVDEGGVEQPGTDPDSTPGERPTDDGVVPGLLLLGVAVAVAAGASLWVARRASGRSG